MMYCKYCYETHPDWASDLSSFGADDIVVCGRCNHASKAEVKVDPPRGHGGKREGAGRKPGYTSVLRKFGGCKTKVARIPAHWEPLGIYESILKVRDIASDGLQGDDPEVRAFSEKILSTISGIDS